MRRVATHSVSGVPFWVLFVFPWVVGVIRLIELVLS